MLGVSFVLQLFSASTHTETYNMGEKFSYKKRLKSWEMENL